MRTNFNKKGFTIIEVVLVLAIAGLIFLMVFVALPTMQRNQRDTARRNDYAAFAANITGYITNNNGRLPAAGAILEANKYINKDGKDQSGNAYTITVVKCNTTANGNPCKDPVAELTGNVAATVYLVTNAKCHEAADGTAIQGRAESSTGSRDYAIIGQLESGVYCQDNV